jgi:adenosylcobyric acid synthase
MLQGTGSDVGKSLLLAGLARACTRRGLRVRPFKPQNMSNNAAVTADGGEIGRAQALQAAACGVAPVADMNPVLLKPQSPNGAQLVLDGRVWGNASAQEFRRLAPRLLPRVLAAFGRLAAAADLVLVEGAGSPAEVNLRDGDIANMGFAEAADVPVVLIGDIERGGVIAQLVGTCALLRETERARIVGTIVNKFRGDIRLFDGGIAALVERLGLPLFGVVPFFPAAAALPAEDSLSLSAPVGEAVLRGPRGRLRIAVPVLPHIANFDDLDPLAAEPDIDLVLVRPGRPLPRDAVLVILPGSKAVIADLEALRREGWDIDILAHRRQGGRILGLCGGYQMLGRSIADPHGSEGPSGAVEGLGLLDIDTTIERDKRLLLTSGTELATGMPVEGYEMHLGATNGPELSRPMLRLEGGADGAVAADGRVAGCYLHGLFTSDPFRRAFIRDLGGAPGEFAYRGRVEATLDTLADHLEAHLEVAGLLAAARPPASGRRAELHREPEAKHQAAFEEAGEAIELERADDVRGRGAGGAVADPGIGDHPLPIAARPGQGQSERPGHRAFRPAGVQRTVLFGVAQHDRDRVAGAAAPGEYGGGGDHEPAEPRRDQVQKIVEACRRPAEFAVMGALVADHAVERVRHLVAEEQRQSADEVPEHRGDDAVAEVFGEALDRGAGDARGVEGIGVAADDVADRGPPGRHSAAVERARDRGDMLVEALLGNKDGDRQDLDARPDHAAAAQALDREPGEGRATDEHDHRDHAAAAARGRAASLAVELPVEKCDGAAGEHHRMRHMAEQRRHVAEDAVEREAGNEQQQRVGDGRRHSRSSLGRGARGVNQ